MGLLAGELRVESSQSATYRSDSESEQGWGLPATPHPQPWESEQRWGLPATPQPRDGGALEGTLVIYHIELWKYPLNN